MFSIRLTLTVGFTNYCAMKIKTITGGGLAMILACVSLSYGDIEDGSSTLACPAVDKECESEPGLKVTCRNEGTQLGDGEGTNVSSGFGEKCSTYSFPSTEGCTPRNGSCDVPALSVKAQTPSE